LHHCIIASLHLLLRLTLAMAAINHGNRWLRNGYGGPSYSQVPLWTSDQSLILWSCRHTV